MIAINHNLPAANVANTLTSHYGRLQTSTQRLSSGLRINSAADDAAGLAIRELMRADISVLQQGARNANDAISMIQTFDGALGVIDEKLIRMKELAEQAATGTYNSTQRLMIDSEFQAMASEINRIARATDFNGIKLLDGNTKANYSHGSGDTETVNHANARIAIQNIGADGKTYTLKNPASSFVNAGTGDINPGPLTGLNHPEKLEAGHYDIQFSNTSSTLFGDYRIQVSCINAPEPPRTYTINYDPTQSQPWSSPGLQTVFNINNTQSAQLGTDPSSPIIMVSVCNADGSTLTDSQLGNVPPISYNTELTNKPVFTATTSSPGLNLGQVNSTFSTKADGSSVTLEVALGNGDTISQTFDMSSFYNAELASVTISFDIVATETQTPGPDQPGNDPNNPNGPGDAGGSGNNGGIPDLFTDKVKIHFGTGNDSAEDYYYINKHDATTRGLGLEGVDIQTQDSAQAAIVQINDAIVQKDKIRAEYGAMQNRLENTVSNLQIQSENIQAAESRISDTDVATEMTNFVRNQILTQSAVAMLSQANSMPQMVMRLIG